METNKKMFITKILKDYMLEVILVVLVIMLSFFAGLFFHY